MAKTNWRNRKTMLVMLRKVGVEEEEEVAAEERWSLNIFFFCFP